MSFSSKKLSFILVVLFAGVGAGWLGYVKWQEAVLAKNEWTTTVDEFRNCSLGAGLYWMGKPDLYEYKMGTRSIYGESRSNLTRLITSGYREGVIKGLDDVWLDPDVLGSLTNKKVSPGSIDLLSQCDSKISSGHFSTGLDLAYYYLYLDYPNATELISALGDRGVTDAYVLVGHAYKVGLLGSVRDEKLAFAYYLKAANSGSTKGMLNTAELLRSVDFEKSKKFVLAAAEKGSLTAAYILQDLNSSYRTTVPGKSRIENDVKVLYFWNLVFSALRTEQRNEGVSFTLEDVRSSPFILESAHGFEFDAVPSVPWHGVAVARAIDAKVVNYFIEESVKENQSRMEAILDSDSRIQVQDRVKQWVSAWKNKLKADNKRRGLSNSDAVPPSVPNIKKLPKIET